MIKLNDETLELTIDDLAEVGGGSLFGFLVALSGNPTAAYLIDNGITIPGAGRAGPVEGPGAN